MHLRDDEIESDGDEKLQVQQIGSRAHTSSRSRNDVVMALDFESVHSAHTTSKSLQSDNISSEDVNAEFHESASSPLSVLVPELDTKVTETTSMEVDEHPPTSQDSVESDEEDPDFYESARPRRL